MIGAVDVLLPACVALVGVGTGLLWRQSSVGMLDEHLMQRANRAELPRSVDQFFAGLRIGGTTLFFVAALVLVGITRPPWALGLALAAVTAEAAAKGLKMAVHRPRPFAADAGVIVRLPRLPIDSSFPSADAMRAAFLAGLTLAGSATPSWAVVLAILLAVVVGVGRVRSGAHYPLDVWTGLTIGFGAVLTWAGTL